MSARETIPEKTDVLAQTASEVAPDGSSPADVWRLLRLATSARIGLGRTGDAMPLRHVLDFQAAHATARDAVHTPLDVDALREALQPHPTIVVASQATDRAVYLRRPDLGRRLDDESRAALEAAGTGFDIAFVIGDGLSATAVQKHAAPLLHACVARLSDWSVAPVVVARQARVALGDEVGECLKATLCAVLIGERPGLSVAESLGIYLTFDAKRGRRDSERNCISNIHGLGGLSYPQASEKLAWLVREARRRSVTGVELKDAAVELGIEEPRHDAISNSSAKRAVKQVGDT